MIRLIVNGQIANDATTLPFSNALLRGDGLFETILAIDQKIIAWQKHYERLAVSYTHLTLPTILRV